MLTKTELTLIHQIADRAVALYQRLGYLTDKDSRFARAGIAHELMTVHCEVIPLRLAELLSARDGDFAHDVAGIHRHLDLGTERATLRDCFVPRYGNL